MVRTLLAVLALQPQRTVTRAEIIDVLWDDSPPASHANLVHVYSSRLRTQLREALPDRAATADLVRCEGGGYQLGLDPALVDRTRFERLLGRAREADAAGDRERAVDAYDAALRCWRGAMLEDLGSKLAQHPLVVEAEQWRVDAAIAHARLCAELGYHEQALDRLRAVAPTAPFHEGLQTQLILALARVGDRGAAFDTYRQVSTRLREEIGVDPGSQLQSVYELLLDGDGCGASRPPDALDPVRPDEPAAPAPSDDAAPAGQPAAPGAAALVPSPRPRPGWLARWRRPTVVVPAATVLVLALGSAWSIGRGSPPAARPSTAPAAVRSDAAASATSSQFTWGPDGVFTPLVHWNWGYGPALGSTSTGGQWASATVTGLIDTYSCAAFRFRVITTPDPQPDKARRIPDAHGILVSVCSDHWQIEAGHHGDFYREKVDMPVSGMLRMEISPDNVVTVTYAGKTFAGHRLRASGYAGRQIFPAGYQGDDINVRMSDVRSNASR